MELESTQHLPISIPLNSSSGIVQHQEPEPDHPGEMDTHLTERILYVLMKYNISMQCYHDLSMILDDLPRSYKVANVFK